MIEIRRACWLTPRLLALLVGVPDPAAGARNDEPATDAPPSSWRVLSVREDGSRTGLPARWLRGDAAADGDVWWLFTAQIPDDLDADQASGSLLLSGAGGEHQVDARPAIGTAADAAQAINDAFGPEIRGRVLAFLAATPTSHDLHPSAQLGAALYEIREALRQPLPHSKTAPGPLAGRLERVTMLGPEAFWLSGWIHDSDPRQTRLTAISPEGTRVQPEPGAVTYHPRPAYAKALDDPETATLGFHAYIRLPNPSVHPSGWTIELLGTGGQLIEDTVRSPVDPDAARLWEPMLDQLRDHPEDETVLRHQILPTLVGLRDGEGQPQIAQVTSFGDVGERPDVSLVIAVRRVDRIEHQLGQFARDPELSLAAVELIYVTGPGADGNPPADTVAELQALYGFPLRLVALSHTARRVRALNLGASVARAPILALMSGDVLPAAPGWLSKMMGALASSDEIGAVSPKLLREDDSIAHAGAEYVRRAGSDRWHRTLPLAGFARSVRAATASKAVQAGSDACLMIKASQFAAREGFSELYLGEGEEAGDLCLRLAGLGLKTWYVADAELYLLDRPDMPRKPSPLRDPFNGWLLGERCGSILTGAMAEPVPAPASRPPIGELEIVPAGASELLRGSSLALPPLGDPRSPYEDTYAIALEGWALATDGQPVHVSVGAPGYPSYTAEANLSTPELAAEHPDAPGADASGFRVVLSSLSFPVHFELDVDAVLADGAHAPIGRVAGRRRPLRSPYVPEVQPLVVTMLGRTGSTWLMSLLSRHPQIVSHSPFVYEPMLASYWTAVLRTLAEPASYMQAILPELYGEDWWTGRGHRSPLPRQKLRTEMARWLGRENVESLAGLCQRRLDAFYREAARIDGRPTPKFFAEKSVPGPTPRLIGELYPEGREIILVRDLRDRVCSIRDYNTKQGYELWGRDRTEDDEGWFAYLRGEAMDLLQNWREREERAHLLRYEDLILEPERTLQELFSYVGVDAGPTTIESTRRRAAEMLPKAQLNHQTSPSVEGSIGRWKVELSEHERDACTEAFDDLLVEFGYQPTAAARVSGSAADG